VKVLFLNSSSIILIRQLLSLDIKMKFNLEGRSCPKPPFIDGVVNQLEYALL
jgi:hypothetical protein